MMKWLDFFSIRQKLAMLLILLLSAVSYLTINSINESHQQQQHNIKIAISQQQQLIVAQFTNAFFFARQQVNITSESPNRSAIKKNQFLFEQNVKAMLYGGKIHLDLTLKKSIYITSINQIDIRKNLQESQRLWKKLQIINQAIPLRAVKREPLDIFYHVNDKLQEQLTQLVTLLTLQRDSYAQQHLLTLQISWFLVVIISALFTWLIARNITQPLDNIAKASSRMRLGDLQSYPMDNDHRDELGTVIYQADEMRLVLSELMQTFQQDNKQIMHSSKQINRKRLGNGT
ncbi:methyl-accepting chemotaxis protein [Psychromonas hadalis]|uniref:methyl-accepting chemotaxis protein n=1 Tax=Psychromonas hadalis TaxID=211669 RepID=UPI0003B5A1AD|nr:methyl-accepting chemotaxis protein [Psychromonas hadalis]